MIIKYRVPPGGPTDPEVYFKLLFMTLGNHGMRMSEDANGLPVFYSTKTGDVIALNYDHYEQLASRGWVSSIEKVITISKDGLWWLGKFLKKNNIKLKSPEEVTR